MGDLAGLAGDPLNPGMRILQRLSIAVRGLSRRLADSRGEPHASDSCSGKVVRQLVQADVVGIVVSELSGPIRDANDEFLRIIGRTRAELTAGRLRWDAITPPEYSSVDAQAAESLRTTGKLPPTEKEYIRPDGSRVPVLLGAVLLSGRTELTAAFIVDLSELKRVEQALRVSEERFRTLAAAAPIGIFQMDVEGRCTFVNERWQLICGISAEEALGDGWIRVFAPELRGEFMARWQQASAARQPFAVDGPYLVAYGQRRFLSGLAVPVFTKGGELSGYVGTVEDVTDMRRVEEERSDLLAAERAARADAQEANRAKDRFLAVLSHELRNPLAPILSACELLRRVDSPDPRATRAVEAIERNARLQARLVDDLLDLSRVARGKVQLHRAPVELGALVRAAVESSQSSARAAGIELTTNCEPEVYVDGDFDRLLQVAHNLVSNAVKFTRSGGRVRVACRRDGDAARIEVEDTGIGIDPSRVPTLFEMFQQGEAGAHRSPGLGIGLALVKGLTELHGGRAWAESEGAGRGSRFVVELPAVPAPERIEAARPPVEGEPLVMLVEDNPDTREMLTEALGAFSYRVIAAESAEEALRFLERHCPDIILADIGLPGMDGYEFLRRARQLTHCTAVPAFAVTAFAQQRDAEQARAVGFAEHFVKPVDLSVLDEHIRARIGASEGVRPQAPAG